jgi:3',5'-cyclic AMP phosphodiesterase CpdA
MIHQKPLYNSKSASTLLLTLATSLLFIPPCVGADDQPIATIAVVSNLYITKLPPKQILDERGSLRDFLAVTGPESLEKTVALVNRLKPDALVVQGSLTWSGSKVDFAAVAEYLNRIEVPVLTVPGHLDRLSGSLDAYRQVFADRHADETVRSVNGVQLVFAGDLHGNPDAATERIEKQLASVDSRRAVLLFAGKEDEFSRPRLTKTHEQFWKLVDANHVALRFDPGRYGHRALYENTLPVWTVGSTAWSERGSVTLVKVFADRIELAQVRDPDQPTFGLTVPNPVTQPRLNRADEDPYGCPSYTADLAAKPDFTFALVSDPQFDREKNRDTLIQRAKAGIAELNRLAPAKVFVAGDLVNNNLPEEWNLFKNIFGELEVPVEVVPGNHDVLFNYDFVEASYSSAPERNPEYARTVSAALADAANEGFTGATALFEKFTGTKPNRIVEHKDAAFITVSFLTMRADQSQLDFLRKALEQTKNKRHVFVVAHYPSLPAFGNNVQPQLGGDEVLSLLQEYRVTGYLFGHRHRNGFQMHERTAHVLSDNMGSIHLLHVFPDRIVIGRKHVGLPLYEKLTIPASR